MASDDPPPAHPSPFLEDPPVDDPRPDRLRNAASLLIVNTGNGKGKSSAAFGVMVRGVARGWNVAVLQFIKSGDWKVGEEAVGRQLGVDWQALGHGFTWDSANLDNDKALAQQSWVTARAVIEAGEHDLIILDELTYLMNWAWIDAAEVITVLSDRPPKVNIVVTGRDASQELQDIADTVTEMREIKHAYKSGIRAKRGIDY
ncbi:MAG: cob(I)yrinic acid a,c-diamide adenosyltransferase [Ilumatobacteraceae bacterium]